MKNLQFCILLLALFAHGITAAEKVLPVTLSSLEKVLFYPKTSVQAEVVSLNASTLNAKIAAPVLSIKVRPGDFVTKGDILILLDDQDYQLQFQRQQARHSALKAKLELAKLQLQRVKRMSKSKSVSVETIDQRRAQTLQLAAELKASQIELKIAKRNLEKCIVIAPFSAVIIANIANLGELVSIGTPLLKIQDKDQVEIVAQVADESLQSIQSVSNWWFITANKHYPVRLRTVIAAYDVRNSSREARFQFYEQKVLPGATGILQWTHELPHLPATFLIRRNKKLGVFFEDKGRAVFMSIQDAQEGHPVMLPSGIAGRVIVEGRHALKHNQAINVIE